MKQEHGIVVLALALALALAAQARAVKSPEEASQAAFEQVQGRTAGARALPEGSVPGRYGLKAAPAMSRPALPAIRAQEMPPPAQRLPLKEVPHAPTPLDRLAEQGFNGVLLSGLLGLGIGGGFGYLTGRFGEKEGEET